MEEDMFAAALAAPTLIDACLDLGMYPKSISDLNLLRKVGKKRDFDYPLSSMHVEKLKLMPEWDREDKCLVMTGKAGTGKTEWALSQGRKVHMITTMSFSCEQMHEDSAVMPALRWNNLWSSVFPLIQVLSMKTLQRCGLRIDPVHLIYATQPGISHTSPVHV